MPVTLRTAAPDIVMTLVGSAIAWPAGRVATGLCDFETNLCRQQAGATWIWLVFVGALLLGGTGVWRLATARRRAEDRSVRPEIDAPPPVVPVTVATRRLAAISAPRDETPVVIPSPAPPVDMPAEQPADEEDEAGIDEFDWLRAQPAVARDYIAAHWQWDYDLAMLHWLVEQPDADGGIAASVFWRALADQDPNRVEQVAAIARTIANRFERRRVAVQYGFDDYGVDELYAMAVDAFGAGAIDFNPAFLPVRSSGATLMLDDLPRSVRPAVVAFLRHIGGATTSSA